MDELSAARPPSIMLFEQLYAAGIVSALIAGLLAWQGLHDGVAPASPVPPALSGGLLIGTAISVAVPLLLLWLIARRRSAVARSVAIVLTVLAVVALAGVVVRGMPLGPPAAFDALRILFEMAALAATFRPDARVWFSKGTS